jgi:hypothetical protein
LNPRIPLCYRRGIFYLKTYPKISVRFFSPPPRTAAGAILG